MFNYFTFLSYRGGIDYAWLTKLGQFTFGWISMECHAIHIQLMWKDSYASYVVESMFFDASLQ